MKSTKKLAFAALFVALSFIGANLKVMGSIAFDSLPAFLGTMLLGPAWGAAIGIAGHFLTALTSGFPFGLPAHLIIAAMMGVTMTVFYGVLVLLQKKTGKIAAYVCAALAAVLVNGPLSVFALIPVLGGAMGNAALFALIPVLSLVSGVNAAAAIAVECLLPEKVKNQVKQ